MDLEDIYENVERRDKPIEDTTGPRTLNHSQDEGKDENIRGSRRLVLMTVCLGIICVLLLIFIILQHIFITAERESLFKSHKNTVEEFNQTINRLQDNYTDLMTEKHQLKNNFNSLSQKNLELERKVTSLSDEVKIKAFTESHLCSLDGLFISSELKSWSEIRQYCRDRGADLVIIDTEEKQRLVSLIKDRVWIGLSDIENEGNMKWVDNSPLKQGFWNKGEPNDEHGIEDCVEIMSSCSSFNLNNWNDLPCSEKRKGVCEK